MSETSTSRRSSCQACGERLLLRPCGCWVGSVDARGSRWCPGGERLHSPAGGVQPEQCGGKL